MVNAEKLTFNVAKSAEESFNEINIEQKNGKCVLGNYQLVILMSLNEKHYISSSFEKV